MYGNLSDRKSKCIIIIVILSLVVLLNAQTRTLFAQVIEEEPEVLEEEPLAVEEEPLVEEEEPLAMEEDVCILFCFFSFILPFFFTKAVWFCGSEAPQ